jgi:hypothetical protein
MIKHYTNEVADRVTEIRKDFDTLAKKNVKDKKLPKSRNQLLILDDITAYLKDKDIEKTLIKLCTNRRHLKLSIILMVQFLRAITRPIRFQVTTLSFFKPANELDTEIIKDEYINLKKDVFDDVKRLVWLDEHDFMMINKKKDI